MPAAKSEFPRIVEANFLAGASSPPSLPAPVSLEIAFAGRSNVGKSSLLNSLLGRRNLARTSSTPGCTRAINFYEVRTSDGARLVFVDLPGYGYAKRSKTERLAWRDLIDGYLSQRPTLAAAVVLVDSRRGLEQEEFDLLELLEQNRAPALPTLLVATKIDRLSVSERKPAVAKITRQAKRPVLPFSIKDPTHSEDLWRKLRAIALGAASADG
jgi:GTP-binding protein